MPEPNDNFSMTVGNKVFVDAVFRLGYIPIVRHRKIRGDANPYLDQDYFRDRAEKRGLGRRRDVKRYLGTPICDRPDPKGFCTARAV